MKTTKFARLLSLVLALVLVVSACFALTAAADSTDAAVANEGEALTPEIISQNVMYKGNFALMYAVAKDSVSGDTVTLNVYDAEPAADSVPVWTKTIGADTATEKVNSVDAYVFTTPGVAAKDMAQNYYITAESDGKTSDVKKYSVAEYLYERLYSDGTAFGSTDLEIAQTALYKSVLEMGKNAQNVIFNFDDNPDNDVTTFVTDLKYVRVDAEGALLDGKYKSGLYEVDATVTITGAESVSTWSVTTIDNDVKTSEISESSTLTVSEHTLVAEIELYIEPDTITYEGWTEIPTSHADKRYSADFAIVKDETTGNSMFKIECLSTSSMSGAYIYPSNTAGEKVVKFVFEADIDATNLFAEGGAAALSNAIYAYMYAGSTNVYYVQLNLLADNNFTATDGTNWFAQITTDGARKLNIRMEYIVETIDGEEKAYVDTYINGTLLARNQQQYRPTVTAMSDLTRVMVVTAHAGKSDGYILLDNVKTGFVNYNEALLGE